MSIEGHPDLASVAAGLSIPREARSELTYVQYG